MKIYSHFILLFSVLIFSGCSTNHSNIETTALESYNRDMYRFNKTLDKKTLKPIAKAHKRIVPKPIHDGISNFFANLGDVSNMANNFLQFKIEAGVNDFTRILFNSTFGIAGIFDVASEMGLEKHDEDFGQTLAKWGVKSGAYIVLPLVGSSTVRDAPSKIVDFIITPSVGSLINGRVAIYGIEKVNQRADLLEKEKLLEGLSTDEYSLMRDVWLQNRIHKIKDGKVEGKIDQNLKDELKELDKL